MRYWMGGARIQCRERPGWAALHRRPFLLSPFQAKHTPRKNQVTKIRKGSSHQRHPSGQSGAVEPLQILPRCCPRPGDAGSWTRSVVSHGELFFQYFFLPTVFSKVFKKRHKPVDWTVSNGPAAPQPDLHGLFWASIDRDALGGIFGRSRGDSVQR